MPARLQREPRRFPHRLALLPLLGLCVAVAACDRATAPPQAGSLTIVSANGPEGAVGETVPLSVRVADDAGNPLGSFTVEWRVTAGGGTLAASSTQTGADGVARVNWALGTSPGTNRATGTASGASPVTFTVQAVAGPPVSLEVHAGSGQSVAVGTAVPTAPALRVEDRFGNPVAGVSVTCTVVGAGGTLASGTATTNAAGVATMGSWQIGTALGTHQLSCTAPGIAAVLVTATGVPGPPASITVQTGNQQSATVGTAVPVAPSVLVRDAHGNPAAGGVVTFSVTEGAGTLTGATATANASGVATLGAWTLGVVAGPNTLRVSAGSAPPVNITAVGSPGAPASATIAAGDAQEAPATSAVPVAPSVLVADQYGNGVPGVAVAFAVATGGGTVTGANATTGADGRATVGSWILGAGLGANTLTATAAGMAPLTFTATARSGPPASIAIHAGNNQTATVGTAVPSAPAVLIRDAAGNPVPGAVVTFSITAGGGSLTGANAATDAAGVATLGSWVLGFTAGANALSAAVAGVSPVTMSATGIAGPAASMAASAGNNQSAPAGSTLPIAPAVIVTDAYGNPVAGVAVTFAVASGGGTITGANATTNGNGVAAAGAWQLGAALGMNSATAAATGLPTVTFQAEGLTSSTLNLSVQGVHLNQGNQTAGGTVGGIANRAGLLRVMVQANEANAASPAVRVRLYQGATLLREETLAAPAAGVPTTPNLNNLNGTWNLALSAGEVVAGLAVEVLVDPGNTVAESSESDNVFPPGGGSASLDVQAIPDLNVVFIPVEATVHGLTGNVNAANMDSFLDETYQRLPTSSISPTLHAVFTSSQDLASREGWLILVLDILGLRTAEGAINQYYHGIVPAFQGMAQGGIASLAHSPADPVRVALSHDLFPSAPGTVAHELGHNMGRAHAPCGSPGGPDAGYPHSDARIGPPGYDVTSGTLMSSDVLRDYMSYCNPTWTSDYTFGAIVNWRRGDPLASPAEGYAAMAAPTTGVLVWGRMNSTDATLNPAFALRAPPALPDRAGPDVLVATDGSGDEVFRFSFTAVPVADAADPEERHFAFLVPLEGSEIERLHTIELRTARHTATQVASTMAAAPTLAGAEADLRLEPRPGERMRLRWDAGRFPMAMVRDAATGQVLSFARGGDAQLATGGRGADGIQILLSDGVRTRAVRHE